MEESLLTLSAFTENSPGVLHRITVMFTRRKLNIESLTVSETETKGISRFTISFRATRDLADKLAKQIARIVEARHVTVHENSELIFKEIAFYKIATKEPTRRNEVEELANRHGAHIILAKDSYVVVENTGTDEEISSLYLLLEPMGMLEFIRSGRIALAK